MKLPTEVFGDAIVVHSPEELTADGAEEFEEFLAAVQRPNVVLDMDHTELVDSAGLEAILNARDRLHAAGGGLKVATNSAVNRKILEITRLDQQLEVFESVVDAVQNFR